MFILHRPCNAQSSRILRSQKIVWDPESDRITRKGLIWRGTSRKRDLAIVRAELPFSDHGIDGVSISQRKILWVCLQCRCSF